MGMGERREKFRIEKVRENKNEGGGGKDFCTLVEKVVAP